MTLPAMAILWLLAISGFQWVFDDSGWVVPLALAALLPLTVEWGALRAKNRGRWTPLQVRVAANVLHVVGFLVVLAWSVYPETTLLGIPTPETLTAFLSGIESAMELVRESVAPLGSAPYLGIAVAAVWWCAAASGAGMWSSGAATLAVAPPVTIFLATRLIIEGTPTESGGQLLMLGLVLVAAGAAIVAGDRERAGARWWTALAPTALVAIILAAGVMLAPLLPGYGEPAAWDFRNQIGTFVPDNPFTDIRSRLVDPSDTVIFQVVSPDASYWRLTALDDFDGRRWQRSDNPPALDPGTPPLSDLFHRVNIIDLSSPWLPVAPFPTASHRTSEVNAATGSLDLSARTEPGVAWEVRSGLPSPTPEQLRGAAPADSDDPRIAHYLKTSKITDAIRNWIRETTAGTTSRYDAILAVQEELRTFEYSLEPDPGHSVNDLEYFLLESQTGYCEQFSAALAVAARELGVPSRIATGYLPGTIVDVTGSESIFEVKGTNAHAWTELWFPGYGWLPFEPTPEIGSLDAPYLGDDNTASPPTTPEVPETTPQPVPTSQPAPEQSAPGARDGESSLAARAFPLILGLPLVVVALVGTIPLLKWLRKSLRRRTGRQNLHQALLGRGMVAPELAAWRETLDWLTDIGVRTHPSLTPYDIAGYAAAHRGVDVRSLAEFVVDALYAPEPAGHSSETARADHMWDELEKARRAFASDNPAEASRAWLRVASLLPRRVASQGPLRPEVGEHGGGPRTPGSEPVRPASDAEAATEGAGAGAARSR